MPVSSEDTVDFAVDLKTGETVTAETALQGLSLALSWCFCMLTRGTRVTHRLILTQDDSHCSF